MEALNRLSVNHAGLSSKRLDGRTELPQTSDKYASMLERASVVVVQVDEAPAHPVPASASAPSVGGSLVSFYERCRAALGRLATRLFA